MKGKTRKRHSLKESDWKTYYGSCKQLLRDVEKLGEDKFERVILNCYDNKFDLAYAEAKYQIDNKVLFKEDFYNEIINIRLHRKS